MPPGTSSPGGPGGLPSALRPWLGSERATFGAAMVALVLIAMVALIYLAVEKLTNSTPVCFIVQGCDTVQNSQYSAFMGIPVSLFGLGVAVIVLASALTWWRNGDRRALYVLYGLGLASVFVIAALVYLELFVIHAICIWCTIAGASLVLGWLVSVLAVRRFGTAS
ncbi:MAG: vitamin K epoxide reductase family protein [Candidatus Limnocylindrales bacterium]